MIVFVGRKGDRTNRYACLRIEHGAYRCGMCKALLTDREILNTRICPGCDGLLTVVRHKDERSHETADRRP